MANGSNPYIELRGRITGGRYRPGSTLVPTAVGAELGLSRTPVREALHRLEFDGLVVQVSRGYRVRERNRGGGARDLRCAHRPGIGGRPIRGGQTHRSRPGPAHAVVRRGRCGCRPGRRPTSAQRVARGVTGRRP
ncbi:GntR family transcriptional regulator [Rhodococcus hoagii]|nr:GntR family transcriptional regulator [Prescottella equi]